MADPVSWIAIGSAVLSAVGTVAGAEGAASDAEAEAKTAGYNADAVAAQAGQAEDAKRKSNREFLSRMRGAFAENNIDPGTGTAVQAQEQSAIAAELDALNIRYEGTLQRTNYLNQRSAAKARAKSTRLQGYLMAGGQLLGGAATAGGGSFGAFKPVKRFVPTGSGSTTPRIGTGPY